MTEIQVFARKWGNSIAVIIPVEVVKRENIRENQELHVYIEQKRPKAGVLWGYLKDWKIPTQQLKDEARTGWISENDIKEEEA